jgi:hypothetical protein
MRRKDDYDRAMYRLIGLSPTPERIIDAALKHRPDSIDGHSSTDIKRTLVRLAWLRHRKELSRHCTYKEFRAVCLFAKDCREADHA